MIRRGLVALLVLLGMTPPARAAPTDPRQTAHVLADGVRVAAAPGASELCDELSNGQRTCLIIDVFDPLPLHGRLPAGAGRTVLILLATPARSVTATLADHSSQPLGAPMTARRANPSGRRWRLRLPARLPGGLDRLSFGAIYDQSNVNFEAGLRVVRRAVDPHSPFRFTLSGRQLLVDLRPDSDEHRRDTRLAGVQGRRVVAVCATTLHGPTGTATVRRTRWPRRARALRVRLPQDVSAAVRFCLLEEPGGADIAVGRFAPGR